MYIIEYHISHNGNEIKPIFLTDVSLMYEYQIEFLYLEWRAIKMCMHYYFTVHNKLCYDKTSAKHFLGVRHPKRDVGGELE